MINQNQDRSPIDLDLAAVLTLSEVELALVRWIGQNPANDLQTMAAAINLSIEDTRLLLTELIKQGMVSENKIRQAATYKLVARKQRKRRPRPKSKIADELWSRL